MNDEKSLGAARTVTIIREPRSTQVKLFIFNGDSKFNFEFLIQFEFFKFSLIFQNQSKLTSELKPEKKAAFIRSIR